MRVTITADDLSPAQFRWVLQHLPAERTFLAGEVRMCATFVTAEGDTLHREIRVDEWVRLVQELNLISLMIEIPSAPAAVPGVMWRKNSVIEEQYHGYSGL